MDMSRLKSFIWGAIGLDWYEDKSSDSNEITNNEPEENYFHIPASVKYDIERATNSLRSSNVSILKEKRNNSTVCTKDDLQLENEIRKSIETRCMEYIYANCQALVVDPKNKSVTCVICNVSMRISDFNVCFEHIRSISHDQQSKRLNNSMRNMLTQECLIETKYSFICEACNTIISRKTIKRHCILHKHILKRSKCIDNTRDYIEKLKKVLKVALYSLQYYACPRCLIIFAYKMNFLRHLNAVHKYNINNKNSGNKLFFNFCIPCAMLWVEWKDEYESHSSHLSHRYLLESKDFMIECMPKQARNLLQNCEELANKLLNESPKEELNKKQFSIVENSLCKILEPSFPKILGNIHFFGSRFTGLCSQNSDIDIYIDCGNAFYNHNENVSLAYLKKCEQLLRGDTTSWKILRTVSDASVPIITVLHRETDITCDFSFSNGLSVETSYLIREFCQQKYCRKLILFLKKWFVSCHFPRCLSGKKYALIWCAIFYLQTIDLLPPVTNFIQDQTALTTIGDDQVLPRTAYSKSVINRCCNQKFCDLLLGFFRYYENFDYMGCIISPLKGRTMSKESVIDCNYFKSSKTENYFDIDCAMCVQDPYRLSENITNTVDSFAVNMFRQYCSQSASILSM